MDIREQILDKLPITKVVGADIDLVSKNGAQLAVCPFHSDKDPSMRVDDGRGTYHCFGCKAHGNAIDWMMEYHDLEYPEAIEQLAEMAQIPYERLQGKGRRPARDDQASWDTIFKRTIIGYARMREKALMLPLERPPLLNYPEAVLQRLSVGWAPRMEAPEAYWQTVLPDPKHRALMAKTGVIDRRAPVEEVIVPVASAKAGWDGLYAVDARNRARWYGRDRTPSLLLTPDAVSADYLVRRSQIMHLTDDLSTWLALAEAGLHAAVLPWPAAQYANERDLRGLFNRWTRVRTILTHQTGYLYDHPLLVAALRHHQSPIQVQITECRPSVVPGGEAYSMLSEYMISRSQKDARTDLAGGAQRLAFLAANWWEHLSADSLYRFVVGERLRAIGEQLPPSERPAGEVDHPLALAPAARAMILVADKFPQAVPQLPEHLPGARLIEKLRTRQPLNPREVALVVGQKRAEPLPAEITDAEKAAAWLKSFLRKEPARPPTAAAVGTAPSPGI